MNELAFGLQRCLAGCRLIDVCMVDLRRLRCDRVIMALLVCGSLVIFDSGTGMPFTKSCKYKSGRSI